MDSRIDGLHTVCSLMLVKLDNLENFMYKPTPPSPQR